MYEYSAIKSLSTQEQAQLEAECATLRPACVEWLARRLDIPEDQAEALSEYARARLADEVGKGLKIAPDSDVTAGVRVLLDGGRVEHDFTDEAVMEALSRVVRPSLAKLAFGK